jgi:hypothetical protein
MPLLPSSMQCAAACVQACQLTVSLMSSTMSTTEASGGDAMMCDTSSLHLAHRHTERRTRGPGKHACQRRPSGHGSCYGMHLCWCWMPACNTAAVEPATWQPTCLLLLQPSGENLPHVLVYLYQTGQDCCCCCSCWLDQDCSGDELAAAASDTCPVCCHCC